MISRSRLVASISLSIATVLCISLTACKHPAIAPIPESGALLVSVVAVTGPGGAHFAGGIATAAYTAKGAPDAKKYEASAAFNGEQPVPAEARVKGRHGGVVDLSALEIESSAGQSLMKISAQDLAYWMRAARKGPSLDIFVDSKGAVTSSHFSMSPIPPLTAGADLTYRPLTDAGHPLDQDNAIALVTDLRYLASATDDYHKDLVALVDREPSLDSAHLAAIMDSVYYTSAAIDALSAAAQNASYSYSESSGTINASLQLAQQFAPYLAAVLNEGLPRVTDLSYDSAMDLLKRLPGQNAGDAAHSFSLVAEKLHLTGDQKLALAGLAVSKAQVGTAEEIVLDWFKTDANLSVDAFVQQLSIFPQETRPELVSKAIEAVSRLSGAELAELVGAAGSNQRALIQQGSPKVSALGARELVGLMQLDPNGAMAVLQAFVQRVTDLSNQNVALLGAALTNPDRQNYIMGYLQTVSTIDVDDAVALLSLLEGDLRDQEVLAFLPKVTDRDGVELAKLYAILSPDARAKYILEFIDSLPKLTTDVLLALSDASPERKNFILLAYIDRLTDFNVANAVRIAGQLQDKDRDSVLLLVLERSKTVTTDELASLASTSAERGVQIVLENLSKVSDLSAASVAKLSQLLSESDKDTLVAKALALLPKLTTQDLILLGQSVYSNGAQVLLQNLDRVTDLTVDNVLVLDRYLSESDRDTLVMFWLGQNAKVSTQDLLRLSGAAYAQGSQILISQLEKVSDLSVDNAEKLVSQLSEGDRDTFLLKAVSLVTDLNSANLMPFANLAYGQRDQVLQKGIDRLAATK